MTIAMSKSLEVVTDLSQLGSSTAPTEYRQYKYTKLAASGSSNAFANFFIRLLDAISHIFCQKVVARIPNPYTGGKEYKDVWVKNELTTQDKQVTVAAAALTRSDGRDRRASSNGSQASDPRVRGDSAGSVASVKTSASDPALAEPQKKADELYEDFDKDATAYQKELIRMIDFLRQNDWAEVSPEERRKYNTTLIQARTVYSKTFTEFSEACRFEEVNHYNAKSELKALVIKGLEQELLSFQPKPK